METRSKLVDAGRKVFADKGVDAASITDITETADVGRGSFYNFFQSKEDLVEAIILELVDDFVHAEALVAEAFADPAEALVGILRYAQILVASNEPMAWFVMRMQAIGGPLYERFHDVICETLHRGREQGRFAFDDLELAYVMVIALFAAGHSARVLNVVGSESADSLIEAILRALGMSDSKARQLASKPHLTVEALTARLNAATA